MNDKPLDKPDWQDRLNTLKDADANAVETIRLAAEWWGECPPCQGSKSIEDVRNKCRIILWTYTHRTPSLVNVDRYVDTEFQYTTDSHGYSKSTPHKINKDAFQSWGSDVRCGPGTRREIVAKIIAHLSQRTSDLPAQVEQSAGGKQSKKATINARMIDVLQADQDAAGWTAKQWACRLKCSAGAIVGTNTWKSMTLNRETMKAERASARASEKRKK